MFKKIKANYILIAILIQTAILRLNNIWYPSGYVFDEVYHAFTAKEFLLNHKEAWEWWNTPPPGVAYEWTHPPLAKEAMALSMALFHTMDAWAYRLPGVIMGVLAVFLVYLVAKKLFENVKLGHNFGEKVALISAFAFSLDGLNFVQSRTGMNDIYCVAFTLATILFFLNKKYFVSAVFLGLALASKWTGLYLIAFIFTLLFFNYYKEKMIRYTLIGMGAIGVIFYIIAKLEAAGPFNYYGVNNDNLLNFLLSGWTHLVLLILGGIYVWVYPKFRKLGWYLFIPPIIYVLSYTPFFFFNHYDQPFNSFFAQLGFNYHLFTQVQQQMWWYHNNLKATHDYASMWWSWPFNLFPVWYYVDYHDNGQISNIFASGNPLMFLLGFFALAATVWETGKKWLTAANLISLILIFGNLFYMAISLKSGTIPTFNYQAIFSFAFLLFGATVLVATFFHFRKGKLIYIPMLAYLFFWLPWALSPRIMFLYHYSPSVPFMTMVLGYKLQQLNIEKSDKIIFYAAIAAIIIGFIFIYPILIAAPLPKDVLEFFFRTNLTKNPFG
jgi:dolichyl-phosphate-mannose-protein mannosyltransferase